MILKGFKEKSIKKQLNLILKSPNNSFEESPIKKMGIIFNADESIDFEGLKSLNNVVGVKPNKLKVIAFTPKNKEVTYSWDTCFNPKDFSWNGKVINTELQTFIDTNFDILISFYTQDILELRYITAASKAKFKVGVYQQDERLNDLIIKTNLNQLESFKTELHKYLKVLNKIQHD
ncbi:DUF6913 domain-containing protein [Mangrovimonas spongiae]|uniref:Uncharacterized protein n=1 Tax=Mangrovimonas spongiae TaxID=2494697 RepID=A0A428JVP9_9FLAO|nr:hypothetical protein [Mangrovimonas spongiae]RSK38291.1 hypothetical protein EJA19_12415 [Mangrovimonas spongiae]